MSSNDIIKLIQSSSNFVLSFILFFSIIAVFYSLSLNNLYTSTAVLTPAKNLNQNNMQSNSLGSLSMLAGIEQETAGNPVHLANLSFRSRDFFEILYKNDNFLVNLMAVSDSESRQYSLKTDESIYDSKKNVWLENRLYKNKKPTLQEAHEKFIKNFHIKKIDRDQIYELSYTSLSSINSKQVLDLIVASMNEYIRTKDQKDAKDNLSFLEEMSINTKNSDIKILISRLIEKELSTLMLSNSSDRYVFDIIESPHIPELKSKPSRPIFCIAAFFSASFLAIFIIFIFGSFNKCIKLSLLPPKLKIEEMK